MRHTRLPPHVFGELLRPHLPALYRLAFRFTGQQSDAEDLLQELLTRLYTRSERLTKVEVLRPWLARALYHLHVDQCRARARTPFGHLQACDNGVEDGMVAQSGRSDDADRAADVALLREHLAAGVAELPAEQQLMVILHDVEGYELHEAAEILGIALGTAKSRLHRARERLRGYLQVRNLTLSNIVLGGEAPVLELTERRLMESDDEI